MLCPPLHSPGQQSGVRKDGHGAKAACFILRMVGASTVKKKQQFALTEAHLHPLGLELEQGAGPWGYKREGEEEEDGHTPASSFIEPVSR